MSATVPVDAASARYGCRAGPVLPANIGYEKHRPAGRNPRHSARFCPFCGRFSALSARRPLDGFGGLPYQSGNLAL